MEHKKCRRVGVGAGADLLGPLDGGELDQEEADATRPDVHVRELGEVGTGGPDIWDGGPGEGSPGRHSGGGGYPHPQKKII